MVLHVSTRGNRALCDGTAAVHDPSVVLAKAMPMNAGGLIAQMVIDIHDQPISDIDINLRARPLAIDANHWTLKSIWGSVDPSDVPVKKNVFCSGQLCGPAGQKKQIQLGHDGW